MSQHHESTQTVRPGVPHHLDLQQAHRPEHPHHPADCAGKLLQAAGQGRGGTGGDEAKEEEVQRHVHRMGAGVHAGVVVSPVLPAGQHPQHLLQSGGHPLQRNGHPLQRK